jgi:hypothetical protein
MTILESNQDTLRFERAFIGRDDDGSLVPLCLWSGILCQLGTHPGAFADGLAGCVPVDPSLAADWPLSVRIQKEDAIQPELLENFTAHPAAIAAVRKFVALQESGQARAGLEL